MKGVVVEQTHVEDDDVVATAATVDNTKDKKKRRRSNRRSKQNTPSVSACSSVTELHMEASQFLGTGSTANCIAQNEKLLPRASNVAFNSFPTMHINEQAAPQESGSMQDQQTFPSDFGGRMPSKSCPESITSEESMGSYVVDEDFSHEIESHSEKKYFAPYWSMEAVTGALERGDVFKTLYRVNAHNRLEAYCKIDGVQTDVLISGVASQNRAIEGDTVVIEVDPPSLWPKMKGLTGTSSNPTPVDDYNIVLESTEIVGDDSKGKNRVVDFDHACDRNYLNLPKEGFHYQNVTYCGENVYRAATQSTSNWNTNENYTSASDPSLAGCFNEQRTFVNAVEMLSALISSLPSKRPTGRVVAILERSRHRDTVVGFLDVKQWASSKGGCKKDTKKNKNILSSGSREHIMLTPTDPKIPKMSVPIRSLPCCIKKRMEDSGATVDMQLVGARIVEWVEEKTIPEAHVVHIFGRGAEIEPQIAAILFENAISSSDFSPESLACLPVVPWMVPQEEIDSRRDLRNLCIFTIDPATATDLDDALSVEMLSNGIFRVGVHIADVSYFVLPDTALDIEAQSRSTNVYLLRSKLPMLPVLLSESLGSLNPGVERLAFSIFWDINVAGEVLDRWTGRTVIRSCCKLSYEHAQDIIDGLFDVKGFNASENYFPQLLGRFEWSDIVRCVKSLHEISKTLMKNRFNDGALSLESPKVVFLFDEDGIPYDSMLGGRMDSNFLVEEFMLLANRTAAEVIARAYPSSALLRRHPEPNLRKLREFETFCSKHGLELNTSTSGQLHLSLERIKQELKNDSVLFDILMSYATRPMQVAAYFCTGDLTDAENDWGHYGLGIPLYTHFTSPLRRYPDIIVHRTLAAAVEAEEMYLKHKKRVQNLNGDDMIRRCFSGICFDKDAAESLEALEALSAAASKHRVPCTEILADVAAYCNERKLASRHARDATDKLYMWVLLKKELLISEAKVLGLGPRFMSIYIHKLAIERRIYYDEVEGLSVEWLDATSTLVLNLCNSKRFHRRGSPGKCRTLEEVALVISPCDLSTELDFTGNQKSVSQKEGVVSKSGASGKIDIEPAVFPLTVHVLSTIPIALHAIGGDDGPVDIGARLYISSYFR